MRHSFDGNEGLPELAYRVLVKEALMVVFA